MAGGGQSIASVTELLRRVRDGDGEAADTLLAAVHEELQSLARSVFASQPGGHTLQATALLHEAWLKMSPSLDRLEDRQHFFALAATAMRQVLVDHARGQSRLKRGGGHDRLMIDVAMLPAASRQPLDAVVFVEALEQLGRLEPRHARVIELRVLGGLTIEETARLLDVSAGTVKSDWTMARAWLRSRLEN